MRRFTGAGKAPAIQSRMGRPCTVKSGLGVVSVCGRSRVPNPAASRIASIQSPQAARLVRRARRALGITQIVAISHKLRTLAHLPVLSKNPQDAKATGTMKMRNKPPSLKVVRSSRERPQPAERVAYLAAARPIRHSGLRKGSHYASFAL